jgi:hypothetical protein
MLFPPLSNKKSEYVDGMAFHWYSGNDRLLDGTYGYEAVNATYHLAPDKILMATEGCSCPGDLSPFSHLDSPVGRSGNEFLASCGEIGSRCDV